MTVLFLDVSFWVLWCVICTVCGPYFVLALVVILKGEDMDLQANAPIA